MSQMKIPLVPVDCLLCQSAYQIDIQLIDEQFIGNRTIQRIKIFLKNFEIEDSSYICLIKLCPIIVESGSDSILLNINSTLFSHVFSFFELLSVFESRNTIYLHPRLNIPVSAQLRIYDCRADFFEINIYRPSITFQHSAHVLLDHPLITMKLSANKCEYIIDGTSYLKNNSAIEISELSTVVTIFPLYNPWNKNIQVLGPCRTSLVPYREMFFTNDIAHIRSVHVQQGQTIQIRCPIDGSAKYVKYMWYYQRYQPKYQISTNRTFTLNNITEHIQGKYMCIGDDGNELLEFEMTLHVLNTTITTMKNNSFHSIIIIILVILLLVFCLILTFIIYYSLKRSSSANHSVGKQNSLTIHHDVMVTIQQSPEPLPMNSLWNQVPYQTFDYIDEQPIYHMPSTNDSSNQLTYIPSWSWMKESSPDIRQEQIPYRFSARHRNVNGQPPTQLAVHLHSGSDMTLTPIVKFHQSSDSSSNNINNQDNDMEILQISVPVLNQYPLIKSSSSIISFDSQIELDEFNRMTSLYIDNESLLVDRPSQDHLEYQCKLDC